MFFSIIISFFLILFFLITAYLLGFLLIESISKYIGLITKVILSFLLGTVILSYLIFISAYLLGFSQPQIFSITSLINCPLVFHLLLRKKKNKTVNLKKLFQGLQKKFWQNRLATLILVFLFLLFAKLWSKMLVLENGNLYAGWISIWGDWAAHLSYVSSFAYGNNFPPEMPILAGYPFSYTFFADFISAIFIKLGLNIFQATLIPSFILSCIFCLIFFDCAKIILKNSFQALIALLVFLFNGGFGFYYFFKDVSGSSLLKTLTHLPREYTHLENQANIQFINHVTSEFIPQRPFLLGLPSTTFALFLLWQYSVKKKPKLLLATALIASTLPLIHLYSFFVLAITALFVFLTTLNKKHIKYWLLSAALVLIFALPQIIIFFPQTHKFDALKWLPGWQAYKMNDNVIWFWFKNIGLSIFLIPLGFFVARKKIRLASLPFFLIFLLANLFLFQPFDYDNTKLFTYWFLQNSLLITLALSFFWRKKLLGKTLAVVFFISIILSGFLDVIRQSQYKHQKIHFLSKNQITAANWIKNNTKPTAIFLTSDNHDNLVAMLTGRKILLGFKGWLWTYNINYSKREQSLNKLVSSPNLNAFKKLNVNYVFFSNQERGSFFKSLEPWLEKNLPKVYRRDSITIYQVP